MSNFVKKTRMGKKGDKAAKDKAAASSASQDNQEDESKTPEPYSCTGMFEADFTELCKRGSMATTEIPPVVVRPRRPATPPPIDPRAKDVIEEVEQEMREMEDPKPTTFVTKDKFLYFKPSVQVEKEDKSDTVTEIYIRGWKVDNMMMNVLKQSLPTIEKLHTLNLWNTGLNDQTITEMAGFLPQCLSLKTLILDSNPVVEESYWKLIGEDSLIATLSLRNNNITDKGAEMIGKMLSTEKSCNRNLINLNLSYNKITDKGAESIANGLRMNRVLLCLSLSSNMVGDQGVAKIAEVLSRFPLLHAEVVERRKLLRRIDGSPDRGTGKSPPPSRRADSKDRPSSKGSGSVLEKDKKRDKSSKKKDTKKEEDKTQKAGTKDKVDKWKKEEPKKHGSKASVVAEVTKTAKGKKTTGKDKKGSAQPESETPEVMEAINPLIMEKEVENIDGQLWIPGNRMLINLNLSRNKLTETGMQHLLRAIQYQTTLNDFTPHPSMKGLMRMSLQRNVAGQDCETGRKIQDMMVTKDPFYKPPSKSPEVETNSHAG